MSTQNLTLLNALNTKMGWLEQNQQSIAQNIANADTPGYQPEALKPLNFKEILKGSTTLSVGTEHVPMQRTNSGHISTNVTPDGKSYRHETQRKTYETAPAGNAVILEEQLLKMNENSTDHRLMTNLYQKNIDMLKMSIKGQ